MQLEHNSHESLYRNPFGACTTESTVTLRLFSTHKIVAECVLNSTRIPMTLASKAPGGYLYECSALMPEAPSLVFYYFRITHNGSTVYYANNPENLGGVGKIYNSSPDKLYQITVYDKDFKTPDWMKNAVVYQIFPDRFYRGKDTPFHGIERKWGEEPYWKTEQFGEKYLSNDFFGGNFDGIEKKLPYLKELGITSVYLNPVSKAFSNHRYDTGDYEVSDETLGTTEDFEKLCQSADKLGIKIILDGVYSHTGADSRYFNKYSNYESIGAYQSTASPYFKWYKFEEHPEKYDSWWGFETLPNVCELEESYLDYIVQSPDSVISTWLKRGASGFRLDVADELPDEFIRKLRTSLKKENKDALLIGEVWEDASNKISYGERRGFLLGNELDSVMNYVFREAVLTYLLNCDSTLFARKIASLIENYPFEALYTAMNLISSHDVPRALTVLSGAPDFRTLSREEQHEVVISPEKIHLAKRRMVLAICLQMTLPGSPMIYYGDERGMLGYADPFNRQCIDWESYDRILFNQTSLLTRLRNENACLRTGFYRELYSSGGIIAYMRYTKNSEDVFENSVTDGSVIVIINANDYACEFSLFVDDCSGKIKDALTKDTVSENAQLKIMLEPLSYRLLSPERKRDICTKIQSI